MKLVLELDLDINCARTARGALRVLEDMLSAVKHEIPPDANIKETILSQAKTPNEVFHLSEAVDADENGVPSGVGVIARLCVVQNDFDHTEYAQQQAKDHGCGVTLEKRVVQL